MPEHRDRRSPSGAYGFRLVAGDPGTVLPDLNPASSDAPVVRIDWRAGAALHDAREADEEVARLAYRGGGAVTVSRDPPEALFILPEPLSVAAMVHPLGTMPMSVLAHWRGDVTLHGGAFAHAGGAWGLCGERGAGKSTTLALLAERGVPILADDLIAVNARDVLAGPRCVDLRPDVAERFASAVSLGQVGERIRYRLPTASAPERAPLLGLMVLEWSEADTTEVTALGLRERLALLYSQQYSSLVERPRGRGIMELLDLPMLRVRRSREWSRAGEGIDDLLAAAAFHSPQRPATPVPVPDQG